MQIKIVIWKDIRAISVRVNILQKMLLKNLSGEFGSLLFKFYIKFDISFVFLLLVFVLVPLHRVGLA